MEELNESSTRIDWGDAPLSPIAIENPSQKKLKCSICMEHFEKDCYPCCSEKFNQHGGRIPACAHLICKDCLPSVLENYYVSEEKLKQIKAGGTFEKMTCVDSGCKSKFQLVDIEKIFTILDSQNNKSPTYGLFLRFQQMQILHRQNVLKTQTKVEKEVDVKTAIQILRGETFRASNTFSCPRCLAPYQKDGGCDMMCCPECGENFIKKPFCKRCGKHHDNRPGGSDRKPEPCLPSTELFCFKCGQNTTTSPRHNSKSCMVDPKFRTCKYCVSNIWKSLYGFSTPINISGMELDPEIVKAFKSRELQNTIYKRYAREGELILMDLCFHTTKACPHKQCSMCNRYGHHRDTCPEAPCPLCYQMECNKYICDEAIEMCRSCRQKHNKYVQCVALPICDWCHDPGHYKKACPKRTCGFCGVIGHLASQCTLTDKCECPPLTDGFSGNMYVHHFTNCPIVIHEKIIRVGLKREKFEDEKKYHCIRFNVASKNFFDRLIKMFEEDLNDIYHIDYSVDHNKEVNHTFDMELIIKCK